MEWNGVSVNIERNDLGSDGKCFGRSDPGGSRGGRLGRGTVFSPPRFLSTVSLDGKSWTRASFYELGHV